MIYINNELAKISSIPELRNAMNEFDAKFERNIDKKSGALIKPITIKYRDGLIQPDRDNPGKFTMPRSLGLKFVVSAYVNKENAEVRYSSTPGRPNPKTGELEFGVQSLPIENGRALIMDKELAFFFYHFSPQNFDKPENKGNNHAWFVIEDKVNENVEKVKAKRLAAMVKVKLFSEVEEGGLNDEQLIEASKNMMIPNVQGYVDEDNLDELRLLLEQITINPKKADEFIRLTSRTAITGMHKPQRQYEVIEALDARIINQDAKTRSFFMCDENGKNSGKAIFKWKEREHDPLSAFMTYLVSDNQEVLEVIKEKVAAYKIMNDTEGQPS